MYDTLDFDVYISDTDKDEDGVSVSVPRSLAEHYVTIDFPQASEVCYVGHHLAKHAWHFVVKIPYFTNLDNI